MSEETKMEVLRAALFHYGEHKKYCEHWKDKRPVCTCGFADALKL